MKNTLSIAIALSLLISNVFSENWENHWIKALEYDQQKNYAFAENEFNLSITLLEDNSDNEHPYVYIDRGMFYFYQEKYEKALSDLNKALESEYLTKNDRCKSLLGRMSVYTYLGNEKMSIVDYQEFRKIHDNFPVTEVLNDKIIIRNIPDSEFYRNTIIKTLIAYKMCESESDIQFFDSMLIVKRKKSAIID